MYIPNLYLNENETEINDFLQKNGFAILVNQLNQKLFAVHVPLYVTKNKEGKMILEGHIAKENPLWQSFENNPEVLAIFSGPHSYVSSSWYDHENVPTWNYSAVHVYGKIKIVDEIAAIAALTRLVDKYEQSSKCPVQVENFSKKTMMQVRGIVAFEIEVNDIQAVKKMSQNRDDKNHQTIITELEATQDAQAIAVAKEMRENRK
jgi:transcriptional regulator